MKPGTVGDLLERKAPVEPSPANRRSLTVRKIGAELNRAIEIRQMLQEHADDPQFILDSIEGQTDLVEACCVVLEEIQEDEVLLEGLAAKIAELQTRKGRMEKSIETRRNIILMAMEKAQVPTIRSPLGTMSSKPTPAKVVVSDEAQIPARFFKQPDPVLDRKALKEALDAKEAVPGASLSNGGLTLSIRTK
jgi:hypothetical protein